MDQPEASASATPQQDVGLLFQPINLDMNAALTVTAAHAGVDIDNPQALQPWLDEPVGSRRQVLRHDHAEAIQRTETYHLITQVESVVKRLDDRLLRQQENLQWLTSEVRTGQKRASGLKVRLTGGDPTMSP